MFIYHESELCVPKGVLTYTNGEFCVAPCCAMPHVQILTVCRTALRDTEQHKYHCSCKQT
jgi:hypothetical protein